MEIEFDKTYYFSDYDGSVRTCTLRSVTFWVDDKYSCGKHEIERQSELEKIKSNRDQLIDDEIKAIEKQLEELQKRKEKLKVG